MKPCDYEGRATYHGGHRAVHLAVSSVDADVMWVVWAATPDDGLQADQLEDG